MKFSEMVNKQRIQNIKKSSAIGYDMSGLLFISDTIEVQGSELEVKHLGDGEYRLIWQGDIFWDVRVNNNGESFDLNYKSGVKYPSGKLTNVEWHQISDAIHDDIERLDDLEDSIADNPMYSAYYSSAKKSQSNVKKGWDDEEGWDGEDEGESWQETDARVNTEALNMVKNAVLTAIELISDAEKKGYYHITSELDSRIGYFLNGDGGDYDETMDSLRSLVKTIDGYIEGYKNGDYY